MARIGHHSALSSGFWIQIANLKQFPGLNKSKKVMYSITWKFNSNVWTTSKAAAEKKWLQKPSTKTQAFAWAWRINLNILSRSRSEACLRNFDHFFPLLVSFFASSCMKICSVIEPPVVFLSHLITFHWEISIKFRNLKLTVFSAYNLRRPFAALFANSLLASFKYI